MYTSNDLSIYIYIYVTALGRLTQKEGARGEGRSDCSQHRLRPVAYIYIYTCIHTHTYTYIHTYIHTYIYIYIYIYI